MSNIDAIKTALEERLQELTVRTKEIDDDLREPSDDDWSESAVESEGDEVLEEVGDLALDEIAKIKLALCKIEDGTYGVCTRCDKKISAQRLEALPSATTCINCS